MKKKFTTETIGRILCLADLQVSPDETLVAYVEHRSCEADGKWYSQVCVVERASGRGIAIAASEFENTLNPRFAGNGSYLAFLSDRSGEMQIYTEDMADIRAAAAQAQTDELCRYAAENAVQKTALRHGITQFSLDTEGSKAVFDCPVWASDLAAGTVLTEMNAQEKAEYLAEKEWAPIEITQIDYKRDELYGMRDGSISHIGMLDMASGEVCLAECDFPLSDGVFSPDGTKIACYGQPYTGPFFSRRELFVMDCDGGNRKQLTEKAFLSEDAPACFTADGSEIIFPAYYMAEGGMVVALYRIPAEGGEKVCLFDPENDTVSSGVYCMPCCRTEYGARRSYFELIDGKVYFLGAFNGCERLYRIGLEGKQVPEEILSGEYSIHEFCRLKDGGYILMRGDYHTLKDLYEYNAGGFRRIRNSNAWMDEYALGEVIRQQVKSKDGKVTLYSAVAKPTECEEGKKYPAVLYLHGGPEVCYSVDFWHEVQILANAGFAVVFCDPRGASGYGLNFSAGEVAWGDEAYDDMIACLDAATELGFIDPERVGITGGSYGGYMTSKIIMMTDRFKAAVGQRIFVNKATSYGTGDIGFYSAGMKWEDIKVRKCLVDRARTSIIRNMDKISTPLLLLHGYADYRCSFEQSEQLFIAMKERRPEVPVKMVMFPEANHGVSRTGVLQHRRKHVQEMTDWFEKYLKEAAE